MISFEKNPYDISIFDEILTENFIKKCIDNSDYKNYKRKENWKDCIDNFQFNDIIDVAENKNTLKFDKTLLDPLLAKVKTVTGYDRIETSGHFIYPPTGYMGWHTNHTNPCIRLYITYATEDKKSFFRYRDMKTKKIITDYDDKGITIRKFFIPPSKYGYFWHCVGSMCDRISFGFRINPENEHFKYV
tara:strand:+ start:2825 stop:3388 length:564 start_codon:yes stop_codon:yes gene_type:complete